MNIHVVGRHNVAIIQFPQTKLSNLFDLIFEKIMEYELYKENTCICRIRYLRYPFKYRRGRKLRTSRGQNLLRLECSSVSVEKKIELSMCFFQAELRSKLFESEYPNHHQSAPVAHQRYQKHP